MTDNKEIKIPFKEKIKNTAGHLLYILKLVKETSLPMLLAMVL